MLSRTNLQMGEKCTEKVERNVASDWRHKNVLRNDEKVCLKNCFKKE